eukprot:SAG31_NODE_117_length_24022_cov_6.878067_23_plen_104_part_00
MIVVCLPTKHASAVTRTSREVYSCTSSLTKMSIERSDICVRAIFVLPDQQQVAELEAKYSEEQAAASARATMFAQRMHDVERAVNAIGEAIGMSTRTSDNFTT